MTDVTCILSAIEQGDPNAAEQLLPLVYDELRKPGGKARRPCHNVGARYGSVGAFIPISFQWAH
jgi:hypothetical protein